MQIGPDAMHKCYMIFAAGGRRILIYAHTGQEDAACSYLHNDVERK